MCAISEIAIFHFTISDIIYALPFHPSHQIVGDILTSWVGHLHSCMFACLHVLAKAEMTMRCSENYILEYTTMQTHNVRLENVDEHDTHYKKPSS